MFDPTRPTVPSDAPSTPAAGADHPAPAPDTRPATAPEPEPLDAAGAIPARAGRGAIYLALFVVSVLAGSALFVSGFTLGRLQTATGGTADSRQELFRPFWEVYDDVTARYVGEVEERQLVEGAIKGLFDALGDPYSGYMTAEEYRTNLSTISGEFEGIGAEMGTLDENGDPCAEVGPACRLTVTHVLRGTPAQRAGLRDGDIVLAVDGDPVEGGTLETLVPTIRGPRGTSVVLGLERDGRPLELTIERDVIRSEDIVSRTLANGRVGYLSIESFSSSVAEDFEDLLRELVEAEGIDRIVVDLRDDPGGFVEPARLIASEFIAGGPVFYEQDADGARIPQPAEPGGVATDPGIDVVVLVNEGTASASEIVAGALQDSGRARLVGETTFGKGTIQEWKELTGDNGGFRLSVKRWLTPTGRWVHGTGLTPDVVVEVPDDVPAGEDPILERALELLVGPSADVGADAG